MSADRPATLATVAAAVGVSRMTVSNAYNRPDQLSPELRERILAAAAELGVLPEQCVVIEDAQAGVQAAKAGGMAAIGVARLDDAALLRSAGADWVVTSLDELPVAALELP